LSLASVRSVLSAIDDEALSVHDLLAVAHRALPPSPDETAVRADIEQARRDIDRYLEQLGWDAPVEASPRLTLANALASLRRLGRPVGPEIFEPYARLADRLAAHEVASVPTGAPRAETVEAVVVGTVVFEAALTALRRLAQAHHSARRFGGASLPSCLGPPQ
jgi:hypothetical protein